MGSEVERTARAPPVASSLVSDLPHPDRAVFASVNRTRLRVWEWGDPTAPVVLAAHGAYDHGRMFDELAPAVAALGYHVRCIDVRGHGDSGPLHTGLTWEASLLDLATLAAETDGPVGLLGHSMGAGMLFGVASIWPERARWIVSLDGLGPPAAQFEDSTLAGVAADAWVGLVKALSRSRRVFPDREAMRAQRGAVNTRIPTRWLDHLVEHGSVATDGGFHWKWDPIFNTFMPDGFNPSWVTDDYAQIECPVLALMGGADDMWTFPTDELEERASHVADIRVHTIADAGHYVHLEAPEITLDHIRAFVAEVDR